jgi:teichuronic acid biosynthesis glycosyltransferase TuaC
VALLFLLFIKRRFRTKPTLMPLYYVLVVTNLWPTEADPSYGSFVKAQMESLRPLGVEFDVLFVDGRKSKWNYLRGIFQVRRQLRTKRYDLIHAHFGLSGWVARGQWQVPVVVSFMGDDVLGRPRRSGRNTFGGHVFRISGFLLARVVASVIVKSRQMASVLRMPAAHVIPNGVDLNLFRPIEQQQARQVLGLDAAKKYVLFPYNPGEERKRFDVVESAVTLARQRVPNLELLLARGLPQERIPLYMSAADAMVMASMSEGSPNAIKEAMAANLPVISVDVGDVAESVGAVEGCFLVPRDARDMAAKIIEVCLRGGRTHGREWIRRLTQEVIARQIVSVYEETLQR